MTTAQPLGEDESTPLDVPEQGNQPRLIRLGAQGGTYELIRPLAQGGMAEVFLARRVGSAGFRKTVAIKRLRRELLAGDDVRAMFLDEARLASHLSHPNIAKVVDLQEVGQHHFLVMEYVHGVNLRALLQKSEKARRPLSPALVACIGASVADALHYANTILDEAGKPLRIVHRDISPHNIVVGNNGGVKLIDFGIAWSQLEGRNETQGAKLKGKYAYMSPEQVGAEPLDGRSDLFSLGVVLVELLTGRRIFETKSESQTLLRVLDAAPSLVRQACVSIQPGLREILVKCLARSREERFADGAELSDALRRHLMSQQILWGLRETAAEVASVLGAPDMLSRPRPSSAPALESEADEKPSAEATTPPARPLARHQTPLPADPAFVTSAGEEPRAETPQARAAPASALAASLEVTAPSSPGATPPSIPAPALAPKRAWKRLAIGASLAAVAFAGVAFGARARSMNSFASQPNSFGSQSTAAAPAPESEVPAPAGSVPASPAASAPATAAPAIAAIAPAPAKAIELPLARVVAPRSLDVRVFAGAPVSGAKVSVIALQRDGSIDKSAGDAGLLASCTTGNEGRCEARLSPATLGGPLRVTASGAGARWTDPFDGMTRMSLPAGAELSSTFAEIPATGQKVPVTLWTTLADAAAAARAQGDLAQALAQTDQSFAKHLGGGADFSLRKTIPEALDGGATSLTDGLRVSLADAALDQWARQLASHAHAPRGSINAALLATLLARDVADGRYDGLDAQHQPVVAPGKQPAPLAAAPLRQAYAHALEEYAAESQPPSLLSAVQRMSAAARNDPDPLF